MDGGLLLEQIVDEYCTPRSVRWSSEEIGGTTHGFDWTAHVWTFWDNEERTTSRTDAVMIHGMNTTGILTWLHLAVASTDKFKRIHVIDVPGFGESHISPQVLQLDGEEMVAVYASVLNKVADTLTRQPPVLIAHSFGTFIASEMAMRSRYPAVCLLCPVGLLPTLGRYGFYWALFFLLGLPQRALRVLGTRLLMFIAACCSLGTYWTAWLYYMSLPRSFGDRLLPKFIGFQRPQHFFWNRPILERLVHTLPTATKLAIVCGNADTIIEPHVGHFCVRVADHLRMGKHQYWSIQAGSHMLPSSRTAELQPIMEWLATEQNDLTRQEDTPPLTPRTPIVFPTWSTTSNASPRRTELMITNMYKVMYSDLGLSV